MSSNKVTRVLAADDEYWSRENIRKLIAWEDYSIEFLEPACDGEEVMERIKEEQPDIILTDINMPFLGGLELLDRLHREYPSIISVAISGYDDFEKVKGVFISGGIDYLLKPVSKEELVKVLTKALGILEERRAQEEKSESTRLQEHKISSFLEDNEYSSLLSVKLYGGSVNSPHVSSTVTFSEMTTMMVKFYDISRIAEDFRQDILQMSWTIKTRLRSLLLPSEDALIFNYSSKMSEFLLAGNLEEKRLSQLARDVLEAFPEETYGPVSVVLHGQTSSLDDIGTVYREIAAALVERPFERSHRILRCRDAGESTPAPVHTPDSRFEEELLRLLKTGQPELCEKLIFDNQGFDCCENNGWSVLEVRQYVSRITNVLMSCARIQLPEEITQMEDMLENLDYHMKCLDARSVRSTLRILLDLLQQKGKNEPADSISHQVENVRRRIEQEYYENITLSSLAEEYHVDASYLSRSFSKKYGETIISFLTRMRIEEAKRLMADPDKNFETISFLVGYDDYNYFSRVFRKKTGQSPSEYRKSLV